MGLRRWLPRFRSTRSAFFFFQAEDGIRDLTVTGVHVCSSDLESGVKPNTLIRFDPKTQAFARATIPSGGGTVRNMAATKDGRVYLACSGVNKVGVAEATK